VLVLDEVQKIPNWSETVKRLWDEDTSHEEGCTPAMVGAVQTFGDLVHWHPHIHAIVAEGVFDQDGCFVPVQSILVDRAIELWRGKVFDILFEAGLLDLDDIGSMMGWKHSGFSIDTSVRIAADDHDAMKRLVEYVARCPFSLARMVKLTQDGKVLYHGSHPKCFRFPKLGSEMDLRPGMRRNYQVFEPLDFLASVTQHIPNKGEHQIRYYGYYSNKRRGMRARNHQQAAVSSGLEPLSPYQLKCRITWAALIKCVYEVDPLRCPKCGADMKVIGFIERDNPDLIRMWLSAAGLWKKPAARAPPPEPDPLPQVAEPRVDYEFFNKTCV
jgi:hypothetical protein